MPSLNRTSNLHADNVDDILQHIRSAGSKDKSDGLADLKRILSQDQQSSNLENLSDKAYHKILETLFHLAQADSSNYAVAGKPTTKSNLRKRLSLCASTIRSVTEAGLYKLRLKTVRALIDHITQTLSKADNGYCEPISTDYFKTLRLLLGYPPHAEHLSKQDWVATIDFYTDCLRDLISAFRGQSSNKSASHSISRQKSRSSTPNPSSRSIAAQSQDNHFNHLRPAAEDILECLSQLCKTPNIPIVNWHIESDRSSSVISNLIGFLEVSSNTGSPQQAGFEALHEVLTSLSTSDTALACKTYAELLPLIGRFWQSKTSSFRDVLSIHLLQASVFLTYTMDKDQAQCEEIEGEILDLLALTRSEYLKRPEREQLQFEDLEFSQKDAYCSDQRPTCTKTCGVRYGTVRAEQSWVLLHSHAAFIVALEKRADQGTKGASEREETAAPKRRRLNSAIGDLYRSLTSPQRSERLYAIQVITLLLDIQELDVLRLVELLELLLGRVSDPSEHVVSWALLAIASATSQQTAGSTELEVIWGRSWQNAARLITSPTLCSAACLVMGKVLVNDVLPWESVENTASGILSSLDLNGPAFFGQTSCFLMCRFLSIGKFQTTMLNSEVSSRVLQWLFARWKPSNLLNKTHVLRTASSCPALPILELIYLCLGRNSISLRASLPCNLGRVAQEHMRLLGSRELLDYLLLPSQRRDHSGKQTSLPGVWCSRISLNGAQAAQLHGLALDLFMSEVSAIVDNTLSSDSEAQFSLNAEIVTVLISLLITAHVVCSIEFEQTKRRTLAVTDVLQRMARSVRDQFLGDSKSSVGLDGIFAAFEPLRGNWDIVTRKDNPLSDGLLQATAYFDASFWKETNQRKRVEQGDIDDPMEIDDGFESQRSRRNDTLRTQLVSHINHVATTDVKAFQASLTSLIIMCSMVHKSYDATNGVRSISFSVLLDHLISLESQDFLSSKGALIEILDSDMRISAEDASACLGHIAQELVQSYEYERCEVALGLCLDIMTRQSKLWTDQTLPDAADLGSNLYEWFIKVALHREIASPHVYRCLSSMLQQVIKICPDYAGGLSLESARTSLFRVLNDGNLVVKFHVGQSISDIFGLFVLKEHENILEDIIEVLPKDGDWVEGIAMRLYVISHLGAAWSSLLRRSVYAICETPQHVPECSKHAAFCLKTISVALQLNDSRQLFRLFAAQIIYTWSESEDQSILSMPFDIFGYASIAALLEDVQAEVVGQIVMRGKQDDFLAVANTLERDHEVLLRESSSKAIAYSVIRDASVPRSSDISLPGAESRLRGMIGKENYASSMVNNFSQVISLVYSRMDNEAHIVKGFESHIPCANSAMVYQEIKKLGASDQTVPPNQQPSFKAGYLIDIINHICRRTPFEAESMWTPSLYIYVLRELLDDVHKALGSLHACSVLRRIRILIAMAGSAVLGHYALEMTLHALRPFLADVYCAEDTVGMMQYLIEQGQPYLREAPSFVVGLAVPTLSLVKTFLGSTQDSTTQESQFKSTLSKARGFHLWFAEYLRQYTSPMLTERTEVSFHRITNNAYNLRAGGNARKGTYEGDLLLEILRDKNDLQGLVNETSRNSILTMLSAHFEHPPLIYEDVLDSDELILALAPSIWSICQEKKNNRSFLLWAGRSLGRAYALTGSPQRTLHVSDSPRSSYESTVASPSFESVAIIIRALNDLLAVEGPSSNGAAERAIRNILSAAMTKGEQLEYEQHLPTAVVECLSSKQYKKTGKEAKHEAISDLRNVLQDDRVIPCQSWQKRLCNAMASTLPDHPLLSSLPPIVLSVTGLAETIFPCVLHMVLLEDIKTSRQVQSVLTEGFQRIMEHATDDQQDHVRAILKSLLYLRRQPIPEETTKADRTRWLEIDYSIATDAAIQCSMFDAALLFLETNFSEAAQNSRRSSDLRLKQPTDVLIKIYTNIDEPDSFYGVEQPSSIASMQHRLEYEHAGFKSLSFTGASFDTHIRSGRSVDQTSIENLVHTLDNLSLNGISRALFSDSGNGISMDALMRNARKLEQWDMSIPSTKESSVASIFRMFQGINSAVDRTQITSTLDSAVLSCMDQLSMGRTDEQLRSSLAALATLMETDEVFSPTEARPLQRSWEIISSRDAWMQAESFEHQRDIISCRETLFSTISKSSRLQGITRSTEVDALDVEVQALLASSRQSRLHDALQHALTATTYLNHLVQPCGDAGVHIEAAVSYESAQVLWQEGEMSSSIRILQELRDRSPQKSHIHQVPSPELLATLGHQVAEARLEKPDEVISRYLTPAIKELHGTTTGKAAGKVFHEFASFCDQQLQNPDALEDFQRLKKLRARKEAEVQDLDKMIKSTASQSKEKDNLKSYKAKAKLWFELDDREYQRLRNTRETFLRQSLENYLLCLRAGEEYNNDALRFSALWLENWNNDIADQAVSKYIRQVATRKFAPLMNQWSSRLLSDGSHFQDLLSTMVTRICIEHPYHGMYQVFASSKTKGGKDEVALSRHKAATTITEKLKADPKSSNTWRAIHNTSIGFVRFATDRLDDQKIKPGSKLALRRLPTGQRLESDVLNTHQRIPPPTLRTPLRPDCDYSSIPMIARFAPEFSVASGISMPKIVTAIGTDGKKYKQLFKGGNDDLRQDSIMEQVFDQVSSLLKSQRATRQRNLGIRTYKVLPLTATSGIIEFVPNTMPLHDYLMPAHARHFPRDMKPNVCRKHISDAQSRSSDHRIKIFKHVVDHFHPVLRYFFTERFDDPSEWFQRRTAYTRSTATISILGHVLGLGDRHGHNILLDEQTGEVVHIDLGIAFEQGRVLPVPELVPFRLTRDLVDGMGITGTEGVFRRCCEFTLEALRKEVYTIMTILDVLRYDPLYSWSLSPLRLKKMQEAQTEAPKLKEGGKGGVKGENGGDEEEGEAGGGGPGAGGGGGGGLLREEEPGEADRALMVVKKKLSKSLSVEATVNELIGQATSVENLALLFCGWAAYA